MVVLLLESPKKRPIRRASGITVSAKNTPGKPA